METVYQLNVPRQLLQVGRMYNSLLNAPALSFLSESEIEGYTPETPLEELSTLFSDDVMLRLFFPENADAEQNQIFNHVLNHTDEDFYENADTERLMSISKKVTVTTNEVELAELRAELIDIIISLMNGNEDALLSLYERAEQLDSAVSTLDQKQELTSTEREALILSQFIGKISEDTSPQMLVSQIIDEEDIDTINDFQHVIHESGKDLNDIFNNVLDKFYEEHPEALKITADSTAQERVDYLTRSSNTIPLLGGLFHLSDRINVDLLYSRDWNTAEVTDTDSISKGEYIIILALLVVQRIQMFAKAIGDETPEELNLLAMSMLVSDLSSEDEEESWILTEGLKRVTATQPLVFNQYLNLSILGDDLDDKIHTPLGALLHRFGHNVVEEGWNQQSMYIAFEKQPIIQEFVGTLFAEHSLEQDEEEEECFSLKATISQFKESEDQLEELIQQLGEALVILAELNVMRDESFTKDSLEWNHSIKEYLTEVAESA